MIKELVHDPIFLALKSEPATAADLQTAQDLLETLTAHTEEVCVGMDGKYDRRKQKHYML